MDFDGVPFPMVQADTRCIGSYGDVVLAMRRQMAEARALAKLAADTKLEIAVFGHGGRDTNCWLAIVEAMAFDESLRDAVHVCVCSCSWPDDEWEVLMARYAADLEAKGKVPLNSIAFCSMKYHEEPHVTRARVAKHLEGKHLIVQCEQGVDMFVEPVTGEWLQDNYEDFAMHNWCIAHAERTRVPVLLLQTNSDLDLSRGIDAEELSANIFNGELQTEAFNIKMRFDDGVDSGPCDTVVRLAIELGMHPHKKKAFQVLLNFDAEAYAGLPTIYAGFIAFATSVQGLLPVAGVLEVVAALSRSGHKLPWCLDSPMPAPQWMLARCLLPDEADGKRIRVVTQLRAARMDTAASLHEFFGFWMFARSGRRVRRNVVSPRSRFATSFWKQLELARLVAQKVRREAPGFELWHGGSCKLFVQALRRAGEATKSETHAETQPSNSRDRSWASSNAKARALQPDFGDLAPLWKWTWPDHKSILDFTCRLLESPSGIDAAYATIASGLPARPDTIQEDEYFSTCVELLADALIAEWEALIQAASSAVCAFQSY